MYMCKFYFKQKIIIKAFCLFATPWSIQTMEFSRPEYWSGQLFPSPGYLLNPCIEPRSPILQADSLPAEPPGKPPNTGVDRLFLLQQIFLTQEANGGLLHCRRTLYQLNYQGNPYLNTVRRNNVFCERLLAIQN